nr:carboxypeptidase-like regulatory domain-containing protein [Parabacteroides goldsteinii]
MKKLLLLSLAVLFVGVSGMVWVSCVSDEPETEIVENPLGDEVYFVLGRVTSQRAPLEGVSVYMDGTDQKTLTGEDSNYQLYLTNKGNYELHFKKDGYVDVVTTVSIDEKTVKRSSITVSVDMTKMSEPVTVYPDEEIEIADPTGRAVLQIMRSLAEKTDVSLTMMKDVPVLFKSEMALKSEPYGNSYASVLISPSETELPRKSTLRVNKLTSDSIRFSSMDLYKRNAEYKWEKQENPVTYNDSRNAYTSDITVFSTYSMRIPYHVSEGTEVVSSHLNGELTVDNCGNAAAMRDISLDLKQRCGWEMTTDLHQLITSSLPGISTNDEQGLTTVLTEQLTSLLGSDPGYYDIPVHLSKISISGNSVLHYKNFAKETTVTCTFDIIYLDQSKSLSVEIKKYTGMKEEYTNDSCYQHSGGSGK